MKKLFKLTAMSLLTVLLVTGCAMKTEYGIKIGSNKKVKVEVLSAMDDEMIDSMLNMGQSSDGTNTKKYTDKERWEFLDSGKASESAGDFENYKKSKYDKDGFKGYIYSLELGKIDELVADDNEAISLNELDKDVKLFTKDGDDYKLINLKLSDNQNSEMDEYAKVIKFDLKLKVTLPNKAKSNNATEVKGSTYIWDLTTADSIELTFDENSLKAPVNVMLIAGGACALVGIGICVFVLVSKKKKDK